MSRIEIRKYISFILMTLFPSFGFGAQGADFLTLESAIEGAKNNSPELKRKELEANSASWSRLEAISGHLPHLEADATHFLDAKYSRLNVKFGGTAVDFPTGFPQTEIALRTSIVLFDGFATINKFRAANFLNDAATLEYNHAKFKLAQYIRMKFYQALAAEQLAKVADQNIETLEQHLKLAQVNRRAGFSTNVNVLRIESQLEEARSEKILATDNIFIARKALNEAMGIDQSEMPLQGALPVPNGAKDLTNLSLDLKQRDDIEALTKREEAESRSNSAAAAFWFPKVSLFGVAQFYKFGEFDPAILPNQSFQNAYSFGFRLSWNLFDGGASIAKKAKADNDARIAEEKTRELVISSPNEFELWKRRYIYNSALFMARKRAVELSTESVRLATISVRAGTQTHAETLDAELELFRARAGVIRAQLEALEALAKLELALGHQL